MSEINVTPFVDVMLVLLIIFMAISPVSPHGLDALAPQPPPPNQPQQDNNDRTVVIVIDGMGNVKLNQDEAKWDTLGDRLIDIFSRRPRDEEQVRGAEQVEVLSLKDLIKKR